MNRYNEFFLFYLEKEQHTSFFTGEYSEPISQRFELAGSWCFPVLTTVTVLAVTPANSTSLLTLDDVFVCPQESPRDGC